MPSNMDVTITHWLPIITICPVNNLPDLVYVSVRHVDEFIELYEARKTIRRICSFKKMFMEDIAMIVAEEFTSATEVSVRLVFNKHIVTITPGVDDIV